MESTKGQGGNKRARDPCGTLQDFTALTPLLDNVTLFCISPKSTMNVIRVEQWGEQFRIVKFLGSGLSERKRAQRQKEHDDDEFLTDDDKVQRLSQSLSRSRSRVRELALCNDWEYFATFTLAEEKQNRFDLRGYVRDLGVWIGNYKKRYGASNFAYLIIPEQHKSGAWHAHGLLHGVSAESLITNEHGYLDLPYYRKRFGYISLSPIRDKCKCASYVAKYITKDTAATAHALGSGYHTFYASRGLQGRTVITQGLLDGFQTDWQNDYVGITWTDDIERVKKIVCALHTV